MTLNGIHFNEYDAKGKQLLSMYNITLDVVLIHVILTKLSFSLLCNCLWCMYTIQ